MAVHSNVAQQVSHWVHDEQACVTVQRIVQTFDLSWSDSLTLLKGIPREGYQYSVTHFSSGSGSADSKTNDAFRLLKSALDTTAASPAPTNEYFVWYALSLEACTESFHTAAERDASQFFDGIESFARPSSLHSSGDKNQDDACSSEGFASSIDVSEAMKERLAGKRKASEAFAKEGSAAEAGPPIPQQANKTRAVPTKKTVTTARNFFNQNSSTSASTSKSTSSTKAGKSAATSNKGGFNKGKTKTTTNTASGKSKNVSSFFSQQEKKVEGTQSTNTQSTNSKKNIYRVAKEEKENVQNKASSTKSSSSSSKVGNADDMKFDQESSDEEIEEVSPPADHHQGGGGAKRHKNNVGGRQIHDVEEDDAHSASFEKEKAAASQSSNNTSEVPAKRRRKRKVMVEKTSMDESGYLYTETKAVWEDVPSDEEDAAATTKDNKSKNKAAATKPNPGNKSKKSSTKPKALKQQSLMGFFKKK